MLQDSDLPEAEAVRDAAEGCKLPLVTEVQSTPEGWHSARCFKENIRLGSLEYVKRYARIPAEANGYVEQMSDVGKTVWYLTVGRTLYAIFGFSDELRKETPEAMRRLKEMNIVTSVMTADNKRAGLYLARLSGAERVAAGLLPTHKAQLVQTFRKGGEVVAVVHQNRMESGPGGADRQRPAECGGYLYTEPRLCGNHKNECAYRLYLQPVAAALCPGNRVLGGRPPAAALDAACGSGL